MEGERPLCLGCAALEQIVSGCPEPERRAIADHACGKYSGRVGRSAAARRFDGKAIDLAVRAHVRHGHTSYDALLARGVDRGEARASVRVAVDEVIERWRRGAI